MKILHNDLADEDIKALSLKMGLPIDFFEKLRNERDDWSFVIKMHAFIEAAVTQLLTTHFGEARLTDIFSNLPLSQTKTGKIAFCRELGLIREEYLRLICRIRT